MRWRPVGGLAICVVSLVLLLLFVPVFTSALGGKRSIRSGPHPVLLELKPPPGGQKKTQTTHGSHRNSVNRNDKPFPFNLFLERQESKRLLGIDVDLFYVRDGVTNEYALRFPVPVPGNMSQLEFSWQNLRPQQQNLNYRIEIQLDNPHAMFQPTLDIPTKGIVPEQPESFVVTLRCTGRSNAEVRVTILVDIFRMKQKDDEKEKSSQQVKIQRKKVCLKDEKSLTTTTTTTLRPAVIDGADNEVDESEEDQEEVDEDEAEENQVGAVGDRSTDRETSRRKKNSANSATMISDEALGPHNNWGNPWGPNGWPVLLVAGAGAVVTGAALASLLATAVCFMRNQKNKRQNTSTTLTSSSKPAGQLVIQAAAEKYCREWVAASTLNGSLYGHALGQGTEVTSMLTMTTPPAQPNRGFGRLMRVSSPVASTIASYSSFRKANHLEVPPSPAPPPPPGGLSHFTLKSMGTLNSSAGQYSTIQDLSRSRSSLLSEQLAELAIDSRYLSLVKLLSEGSFGRVYHAVLNDGSAAARESPVQTQSVLVKTVTNQATSEQVEQFMQEGMMLFGMNHANVHQVVGTCMDMGSQPALIYPSMNEGNLKQFLRRNATSECGQLSPQELVDIAVQIAEGLIYLHRRFFLHKDVATRNCLLDERLHVKLGDNALARDIFPEDYNCLGDGEYRPIAWLAIESLQNREFTPASDLWMFGVTLWELLSLGKQPFADVDPSEMAMHLRSGHRLPQPTNAPDELYSLMCRCWCLCPGDRVTLPQATRTLADVYSRFGSSTGTEMSGSREALTSSRRLLVPKHTAPHSSSRRGQTSTVGSTSSFKPNGTPAVFRDDEVIYANDVLP